jgi:hypothetical protein
MLQQYAARLSTGGGGEKARLQQLQQALCRLHHSLCCVVRFAPAGLLQRRA